VGGRPGGWIVLAAEGEWTVLLLLPVGRMGSSVLPRLSGPGLAGCIPHSRSFRWPLPQKLGKRGSFKPQSMDLQRPSSTQSAGAPPSVDWSGSGNRSHSHNSAARGYACRWLGEWGESERRRGYLQLILERLGRAGAIDWLAYGRSTSASLLSTCDDYYYPLRSHANASSNTAASRSKCQSDYRRGYSIPGSAELPEYADGLPKRRAGWIRKGFGWWQYSW